MGWNSLVRLGFSCTLAALIAGCATPGVGVAPGQLQRASSIGVVSIAGDEAWLAYTGITVFENSERTVPIATWGLDQTIERAMQRALTEAGAKRVEIVTLDRPAVARVFRGANLVENFGSRWADAAVREALMLAGRKAQVDLLVVAVPSFFPPVQHRSETLRGFSVAATGSPFRSNPDRIRAALSAKVVAINVGTGEYMGEQGVSGGSDRLPSWMRARPPVVVLEPEQWQRGFTDAPSAAQLGIVRAALEQLTAPVGVAAVYLLDPPASSPTGDRPATSGPRR